MLVIYVRCFYKTSLVHKSYALGKNCQSFSFYYLAVLFPALNLFIRGSSNKLSSWTSFLGICCLLLVSSGACPPSIPHLGLSFTYTQPSFTSTICCNPLNILMQSHGMFCHETINRSVSFFESFHQRQPQEIVKCYLLLWHFMVTFDLFWCLSTKQFTNTQTGLTSAL